MRKLLLSLFLVAAPPVLAQTVAPPGQTVVDARNILRGTFVEEHQMEANQKPMHTSGHFVVAPANGMLWSIEKPLPTTTIVTPTTAVQDIAGLTMKLPIKNLAHIYALVGGALAGNWQSLDADFAITKSGDAKHWQMLLTPRPGQAKLPYSVITVSGSRFIDSIALTKADGNADVFTFSDEVLAPMPLAPQEAASFQEASR